MSTVTETHSDRAASMHDTAASANTRSTAHGKSSALATLRRALGAALQWRILLWWLLALAVPTAAASLPIVRGLIERFGFTPAAAEIARGEQLPLLIDGVLGMSAMKPLLATGALVAALLTALLSPWLSGMVVASLRAGRRLSMGELAHGGLSEYWRMARMLVWSLVVLGIASQVGDSIAERLQRTSEDAILASDALRAEHITTAISVGLLLLAHLTLEAGRAVLATQPQRRSAVRAWGHGLGVLWRRPLAALLLYVGIAVVCYGLALGVAWLRIRMGVAAADAESLGRVLLGLLLSQLVVALIAWARVARLYGFASLARDDATRASG